MYYNDYYLLSFKKLADSKRKLFNQLTYLTSGAIYGGGVRVGSVDSGLVMDYTTDLFFAYPICDL